MSDDKPTYVSSGGRTFRFASREEAIRNSTDSELDLMLYANGTLESSTPRELAIARDEIMRRKQ